MTNESWPRVHNSWIDLRLRLGFYVVKPIPRYVFTNTRSDPSCISTNMTVCNLGEGSPPCRIQVPLRQIYLLRDTPIFENSSRTNLDNIVDIH